MVRAFVLSLAKDLFSRAGPSLRAGRWLFLALLSGTALHAQAWSPDASPGRYRNPIIFADYSDPDVIRVGREFYMVASSFGSVPALPILESHDLVHWRIANHAIARLGGDFDMPQHGNGVWAPSIRFHDGWYYIFYGDPDRGIYMVRAHEPLGTWESPVLVRAAKGWIDPCPFWDDDGNAYLVHAFANSRAGIKSVLHVNRMSPDGTRLLDDGALVFDGHANHPTIEGPKFYKRDGWYYIFAPAGGVSTGWQTVLRSRSPLGPYEDRIVMRQGRSNVNGPHQGGWVELENGDDWFVHFQDRGAAGRVVHLEPMTWHDGWPVIGLDADGSSVGEPVAEHAVPRVNQHDAWVPATTDEFSSPTLGEQWQWDANPQARWMSLIARAGWLRLFAKDTAARNLWSQPNVLLQKFAGPAFVATTRVELAPDGDAMAGLTVFGTDYAFIGVGEFDGSFGIVRATSQRADTGASEHTVRVERSKSVVDLRVSCTETTCSFSYSTDGISWSVLGDPFTPKPGRWVGARVGLFTRGRGFADFDFFRVTPP